MQDTTSMYALFYQPPVHLLSVGCQNKLRQYQPLLTCHLTELKHTGTNHHVLFVRNKTNVLPLNLLFLSEILDQSKEPLWLLVPPELQSYLLVLE